MSRAVVEKYFVAMNSDAFDDLGPLFADDVEIHTVRARRPVIGRAAAVAHFPTVLANYAGHDDLVTRWIETPTVIVTETLRGEARRRAPDRLRRRRRLRPTGRADLEDHHLV